MKNFKGWLLINRENEKNLIKSIPSDKLADFVFMHLRNMWAVDGLYYLFIEEKFGIKDATEIDKKVWEIMGKIEARKIKEFFDIKGRDIPSIMKALSFSGWSMDLEDKEINIQKNKGIIRNISCRVQNTRLRKGLSEFGCKPIRLGFLTSFAKEFNPEVKVKCIVCPPDKHKKDLWCEWELTLNEE